MARVLEIPFREIGALAITESEAAREGTRATQVSRVMCGEVRADGRRCRYPAMEGNNMCLAHAEWKASALGHLPFPDDALGLQRLMARLLGRLLYENLDPVRARVAVDVCRIMRRNLEACRHQAEEAERDLF